MADDSKSELPLVVLYDFIKEAEYERPVLDGIANVECWNIEKESQIPLEKIGKVKVLLLWNALINKPLLEKMTSVKGIVRVGAGFDSVDLKAAGEKGIYVANVPDYGVEEVADSAISLMLSLMRKTYFLATMVVSDPSWPTHDARGSTRLRGKQLGIIGLGKIGSAVAVRAKVFGLNVVFFDPYKEDGYDKSLGIQRVNTLKELLETSDVISIHCDLNESSYHLLNKETFSYIPKPTSGKKGVYLINTARGPVVDENALKEALDDGRVYAAALDVVEKEPYRPQTSPLNVQTISKDQLIITPHTAYYSDESYRELRMKAALEVKTILLGNPPRNCVNKQFLVKNPTN